MTTTATAPAVPAHLASHMHGLRFARGAFMKMFDGIPDEKYATQPKGCANHALWTLGHIVCTDDFCLTEFAKQPSALPESWHGIFGMGSKPVADASKYPPLADVRKALAERRAAVEAWVLSLTPAQLQVKTSQDWQPYAPTIADVIGFITWHEGYHGGQLAPFRRGLGLSPAFG